MKKIFRWYDYITINVFYFGLTTRSQTLTPLILPLLVQKFAGDTMKGSAYGNLRLWSLMMAVLVQGVTGILSDRSTSRFGRRRPFMLFGGVTEVIVFIAIGVIAATLDGITGYWVLFAAYMLSMVCSNVGQAAAQGLIPDIVPEELHGRFSGVKAFFELPAPLIFVSFVITKFIESGSTWRAIMVLCAVVLVSTILAMFAPEKPHITIGQKNDWNSILRLFLMTAVFTLVILISGGVVKFGILQAAELLEKYGLLVSATLGMLGMLVAVVLGVWASVKISFAEKPKKETNSFTWWVVNRLAFLVGATNIAGFAIYYLQERSSNLGGALAAGPTALLMMFVGIAILLSSIPAGWLSDKFGRKTVCAFSGVLAMFGMIVVLISSAMTTLYLGGVLVGVAIGFFYSASWALGTTLVPKAEAGRYLGVQNLAGAGAGAIGAYIGGPIGDGVGFTALMIIFGLLFLLSSLALLGIREEPILRKN